MHQVHTIQASSVQLKKLSMCQFPEEERRSSHQKSDEHSEDNIPITVVDYIHCTNFHIQIDLSILTI